MCNTDLLRKYEIVSTAPYCDAVGTLMKYGDDYLETDPETVLTTAMETEGSTRKQFPREVLDKELGNIIFKEFMTDILQRENRTGIVNFDALGTLAEFSVVGTPLLPVTRSMPTLKIGSSRIFPRASSGQYSGK